MKKHSLLMLLPFALIVTGCGNLSKGSIFNEKFMKANFGEEYTKSSELVAPQRVDLALGDEINAFYPASGSNNDLIFVRKTDGKSGWFSVIENKYVLPLDDYFSSGSGIKTASGFSLRFPYNYKVVDGKEISYLYDEYGNKIFEGEGFGIALSKKDLTPLTDSDAATLVTVKKTVYGDQVPVAFAYYTINAQLKEVISAEEYFKRHAYSLENTESLAQYGHPELIHTYTTLGNVIRCQTFNVEKNKFVATYTVPNGSNFFRVGDYWYYQVETQVHARESKYDYLDNTTKKNIETYRVNYLNGKVSSINTKIVFSKTGTRSTLLDTKGNETLIYFANAKEILKDKTLSTTPRNIILNEKFKEVADVSGIDFKNIKPMGKYWRLNNIVYDSKMKEVGYLASVESDDGRVTALNYGYGLVDYTGKYIVNPEWANADILDEKYYLFYNNDLGKVYKIENEKAVELCSLDLTKYTPVGYTASNAHVIFEEVESSKNVVIDITNGYKTDLVEPGTGDVYVFNVNISSKREGTLKYGARVYVNSGAYSVIYSATRTSLALAK